MHRHPDTFMQPEELGARYPAYRPTYDFDGDYVNFTHRALAQRPVRRNGTIRIGRHLSWRLTLSNLAHDLFTWLRNAVRFGASTPGWLRPADALKLYELAYYAHGDVLELGSYHGLSTCILAQANRDRPDPRALYTVDLDPACVITTLQSLRRKGLAEGVTTLCDDAVAALERFAGEGKQFALVFVDPCHTYAHVLAVCRALPAVVAEGGFCLFHDYNNPDNRDDARGDYGVYQAVRDGLDPARFAFYGVYGCAGLFRKE